MEDRVEIVPICAYCGDEIEGEAFERNGDIFCGDECADLYAEENEGNEDVDEDDDDADSVK